MPFENLVGQAEVKRKLSFYIEAYQKSRSLPFLNFIGARGLGKTNFVRDFAQQLTNAEGLKKPLVEINSSSIKTSAQFFEQVYAPYIQDKDIVIFFDECHALPKDFVYALLTILNTEQGHIKEYNAGNTVYTFDFKKQNFIFATTESDKLFIPLRDRLTVVEFADYSNNELKQIFVKNINNIEFDDDALDALAETSRGNARSCVLRAKEVAIYCENYGVSKFTINDASKLFHILGILPHGLNRIEWQILNILRNEGRCSLSALAAKTGLTRTAIQKDFELFLIRKGFLSIDGLRGITIKGSRVIENYNKITCAVAK
jgi:Holliday junction resolvasome RuvABC ATP-dependent DNA helicase subunit